MPSNDCQIKKHTQLNYSQRKTIGAITTFVMLVLMLPAGSKAQKKTGRKPNILFIAIDDLKPVLGCYGDKLVKTPNIDRLAASGTVFLNTYCQQAVCGPTRASLMTGKRPDYTKVWDLKTKMRDINPEILSLPQYLISQGYSTQGIGKVYDPRDVDKQLDAPSWSVPFYNSSKEYFDQAQGEPVLGQYQSPETKALVEKYNNEAIAQGMSKKDAKEYVQQKIKPSTECINVPDNAYEDGAIVFKSLDILARLSKSETPFFFAVGIHKPHLPFVAPKKYWDLYRRDAMPLARYQEKSKNAADIAYTDIGEMRNYTDIPPLVSFTDQKGFGVTLPADKQKELLHGYYAAVSYSDALVGMLLRSLDSLKLADNTIVVLWGDHGWHLGDHNLWCKHTNFEQATRVPLIICAPGLKPGRTSATSEFVDLFPTLCDLAGVPQPDSLDGKSLLPVIKNNTASVKEFAVSQYPRSGSKDAQRLGLSSSKVMGYSIRNQRYRYTVWMGNDFRSTQPFKKEWVVATEMYDYQEDPDETVNVVADKKYEKEAASLYNEMLAFFKSQERN